MTLRALLVLAIAAVVGTQTGNLVLMLFAGALLAVFLRIMSNWVCAHTPISSNWAFGVVVLGVALVIVSGGSLLSPQISTHVDELKHSLPGAVRDVRAKLEDYSWGCQLLSQDFDLSSRFGKSRSTIKSVTGAASTTLTLTTNLLIILIFGLYLGAQPRLYVRGFLQLFPKEKRENINELLEEVRSTLAWWLLGRFSSMAIIGILTSVGLLLLDIPLAVPLWIFAALLTFIPNIGPVISALPALLLGFVQGPATALNVFFLYVGTQTVESYLITPMIQKKAVSLPPVLTLSAQILMGLLFGAMGLLVATPITAAGLVLIRRLYVDPLNRHAPK